MALTCEGKLWWGNVISGQNGHGALATCDRDDAFGCCHVDAKRSTNRTETTTTSSHSLAADSGSWLMRGRSTLNKSEWITKQVSLAEGNITAASKRFSRQVGTMMIDAHSETRECLVSYWHMCVRLHTCDGRIVRPRARLPVGALVCVRASVAVRTGHMEQWGQQRRECRTKVNARLEGVEVEEGVRSVRD